MQKRNSFATMTPAEKAAAYYDALGRNAVAHRSDGTVVPLLKSPIDTVEFIAGLWRVQNPFNEKTIIVRRGADEKNPREFVLGAQLPRTEENHFKYYSGRIVAENCYGKYTIGHDMILANFMDFWSYGESISAARAYLGIKLFDTCKNQVLDQLRNNGNSISD